MGQEVFSMIERSIIIFNKLVWQLVLLFIYNTHNSQYGTEASWAILVSPHPPFATRYSSETMAIYP